MCPWSSLTEDDMGTLRKSDRYQCWGQDENPGFCPEPHVCLTHSAHVLGHLSTQRQAKGYLQLQETLRLMTLPELEAA